MELKTEPSTTSTLAPQKDTVTSELNYDLEWIVPDFKQILANTTIKDYRPKTDLGNCGRFHVKLQFHGKDNDMIEIYYACTTIAVLKIALTTSVKTSYKRQRKEVCVKSFPANHQHEDKWQHLCSFYKKDLENCYLEESSLYLKFRVTYTERYIVHACKKSKLKFDLTNLLQNGLFSDAVMESADGKELNVHKAVLASRSEVFKALFQHDTIECYTSVIKSPFESDVLKEVLLFIYSDKAEVNSMPEKLLAAADYYQLIKLKNLCEHTLNNMLNVDNVIEILQLADLHSAMTLKHYALNFIKNGQAKRITKTKAWGELGSIDILKKIYEHVV